MILIVYLFAIIINKRRWTVHILKIYAILYLREEMSEGVLLVEMIPEYKTFCYRN